MQLSDLSAFQIAENLNRGRARTKPTSQGFMALCPNHADRNPSLSIRETESGRIKLHCFAPTCSDARQVYEAVERALNLDPGRLRGPGEGYEPPIRQDKIKNVRPSFEPIMPIPDDAPPIMRKAITKKFGRPTKLWSYKNEIGRVMSYVARYDIPATDDKPADKVIWPWTFGVREGRREWCVGAMPEPRILFNLDKIVENPEAPVLFHEGEKAADAGEILFPNWISTTTPGGSSAPHMTDFQHLAGRIVIISPDNDAPGAEYAALITAELLQIGAKVMILRFPTAFVVDDGQLVKRPYIMREGDDMDDHLRNGWTTNLIREAVTISGIPLTWPIEDWQTEDPASD